MDVCLEILDMNSAGTKSSEILVVYGNQPEVMIPQLLERSGIQERLPRQGLIALKPNLVLAKPSSSGATTDPVMVSALINWLQQRGFCNLVIMESSWLGDSTEHAFEVCGYRDLAKRMGIPLINLKTDATRSIASGNLHLEVCEQAWQASFLINLPVLKAHCQTKLTCALKNLKGCIPDSEKRRYHTLGLHEPIARLNTVLKSHLTIVDGIIGDLSFEEGGNPVMMNRLILGCDPVLIDAYAASLLGYQTADIPYIGLAESLGVGSADIGRASIIELNQPASDRLLPISKQKRSISQFGGIENQACSACYGSLLFALERLQEKGLGHRLPRGICIGQGFKEASEPGPGIGTCTRNFAHFVAGCPPTARDIVAFLEEICHRKAP